VLLGCAATNENVRSSAEGSAQFAEFRAELMVAFTIIDNAERHGLCLVL
jgi:hypothetical protein